MIRRLRYALTIVRDISMILCPASAFVRARVDEVRDADLLAEREEHVDVMEPWRFGPAAGVAAGTSPGQVSVESLAMPCPGRQEPTEELLLAAANWLDEYSRHMHFNHLRQEYLCALVHQLRDRATLFAQNR